MRKILHKAKNHKEAKRWDIYQQIRMTPEERKQVAKELKRRFYGDKLPDIRSRNK